MIVELEEHEIQHIENALKGHYKDEWCAVCDKIAEKLGFEKEKRDNISLPNV